MTTPSWLSSSSSSNQRPERTSSFPNNLLDHVKSNPIATPQIAAAFILGSLSTIGLLTLYTRYLKRIPTSDWVHPKLITKKRWIKGVVTSVGDGDGFRLYHTPGVFWRWPVKFRHVPLNAKDLKDETIHIRLAGVDAPELGHFGKEPQPYALEALTWLKSEIEGKRIWAQLIRRDQYGRIVSIPIHPPRIPLLNAPASRCISISMLRAGYARTYEQSGAEYGRWGKDQFLRYEEDARLAKRGMWASKVPLESPSDYKKRYREGIVTNSNAGSNTTDIDMERRSPVPQKTKNWTRFLPFWR